jgi:predicted DsbA family dithiol-disulfide isomerase
MEDALVQIEAFGDPACPWDFSAEPARLRLQWRYGDAIAIRHRMVGLSSTSDEYARRGVALTDLARGHAYIRDRFGMPIDTTPAKRYTVTVVACRAVVGVRRNAPTHADAFLRALRVAGLSTPARLDAPETIAGAARTAHLSPEDVEAWAAEPATDQELAEDMAAARAPSPAALALRERLATTLEGMWRYTCPSYRFSRGDLTLDAPGFQPARVYEVLIANLAPELTPRPDPHVVEEVLAWAPYPLATAEVAGIMEVTVDAARDRLVSSAAQPTPVANDAYWSLEASAA